jgi:kojibiose phosphorylase
VRIYERMERTAPEELTSLSNRLELTGGAVDAWREIIELIYLPEPEPESLLIEQFDGYFDLEDVRPDEVRERLLDPEEYWGWPSGVAVTTQVLKQADVLQLFALHDRRFPTEVMRANYDYYEPRTEHGSSLSPSVHALIASYVGYRDQAYRYFKQGSTIDLYARSEKVVSGDRFLGGIHTAACGGVWQMIVQGFAGFRVDQTGIGFQPAMPDHWERLSFKLIIRGNVLDIEIVREHVTIEASRENKGSVDVHVGGETRTLEPGDYETMSA